VPGQSPGRNNRFGPTPRSAAAASGPAAGAAGAAGMALPVMPSYAAPPTELRPASAVPGGGGGGGTPPPNRPDGTGPGGTGPSRRPYGHNRRVAIGALTVLVLGAAAYGWSLAAADRSSGTKQDGAVQGAGPSLVATSGKCVVSYAVMADDGKRFDATVTIANRDNTSIKNWNLWFIMQGDQTVTGRDRAFQVEQTGKAVTVKGNAVLNAKKAVTMQIDGRYDRSNIAPMRFELGDQKCETYVSGKPGEPSRQVQQLSNGQVRLGPPITRPRDGLNIGPNGTVVPVPGPTRTPTGGPTTKPGPGPGPSESSAPDCKVNPDHPDCPPVPDPDTQSPSAEPSKTPPSEQPTDGPDPDDQGDDQTTDDGGSLPSLP
jgi:eukaryotic-like serine/threonine-protein kinase